MTRHVYAVDRWGVGELWVDGSVVVAHELPQPGSEVAAAAPEAGTAAREMGAQAREIGAGAREVGAGAPTGGAKPPLGTLSSPGANERDAFVSDLCRRFHSHFGGERVSYEDVDVDLSWCSPFQAELARALQAVPWGEVVSYGELAALAGRPGAARAAGSFCAQNRFALILPCHRVVAADGIGGYGMSGVERKRRLLALEGVSL